ncbi:hypothetical protein LCGC14_0944340 [marine sediment metagenome]|uniref:Thoeris anti-defense 2-like domain-containing protein n=1 Tax=marine sediment metagenome TaxID=412755 RepID=A0A0F9P583_9ZZZZ
MCVWSQSTTGGDGGTWFHNCNCPNCTCGANQTVDMNISGWVHTNGTFEWALQQMRQGLKVRRQSWVDASAHVYLLTRPQVLADQIRTVGQHGTGETAKDTVWEPNNHLLATDWEIYVKKCGECGHPKP